MKILHIVESTATGTLAMIRLQANTQCADNEVLVAYSRRPETPSNIEELFEQKVRLIPIDMNGSLSKAISLVRIRSLCKSKKPDVVLLHSSFAGFIGRLATIGLKCRLYYFPHCISFMRKDISKSKRLLFVLLERIANINSCTYVPCSYSELREIQKFIPRANTNLIINAVDVQRGTHTFITEYSSGLELKRKITIVTVGQIRRQKDPSMFASIARDVIARSPVVEFFWIGDGDVNLKNVLIRAGVTVLGWLPHDQVVNFLEGANAYLSTSEWEGLPVSVIEALSCNLDLFLRRSAGNTDVAEDGLIGTLFDTPIEAVDYLSAYIKSPEAFKVDESLKLHSLKKYEKEEYCNRVISMLSGPGPSANVSLTIVDPSK